MSVFAFGYTVGTWPLVIRVAERRETQKSSGVMLLFDGIFFLSGTPTSTDVYEYLHCHYVRFTEVRKESWL